VHPSSPCSVPCLPTTGSANRPEWVIYAGDLRLEWPDNCGPFNELPHPDCWCWWVMLVVVQASSPTRGGHLVPGAPLVVAIGRLHPVLCALEGACEGSREAPGQWWMKVASQASGGASGLLAVLRGVTPQVAPPADFQLSHPPSAATQPRSADLADQAMSWGWSKLPSTGSPQQPGPAPDAASTWNRVVKAGETRPIL